MVDEEVLSFLSDIAKSLRAIKDLIQHVWAPETIIIGTPQAVVEKVKGDVAVVDTMMYEQTEQINKEIIAKQYSICSKPCDRCNGNITWDLYPTKKHPIHVDEVGAIIGDGSCPKYDGVIS